MTVPTAPRRSALRGRSTDRLFLGAPAHRVIVAAALGTVAVALPSGAYALQAQAVVALIVWSLALGGLAMRLLPRTSVPTAALAGGACLAGLAALTAASAGWASNDGVAFEEAVRAVTYTGVFVLVVLVSPAGSGRAWLQGLALGLLAVSLLGLASRFEPSIFSEHEALAGLPERGRLSYPLGYWNAMGATLALATVLALWLAAGARTRVARAAATAAVPLPVLGLFLTSSRGGTAGLAVGLGLLFAVGASRVRLVASGLLAGAGAGALIALAVAHDLFTGRRVEAPGYGAEAAAMLLATILVVGAVFAARALADGIVERIRVPRAMRLALAALAAVLAVAVAVAIDPAQRLDELTAPPDPLAETRESDLVTRHLASTEGTGRWQFWQAGWRAFESEPLVGIGAGGYEAWWAQHGSIERFVRNAHSLFVETGAELGLLGLGLLLGFVAAAVAGYRRRRSASATERTVAGGALAVLACGLTGAALEWTWELPGAFVPVIVAAAVLAGPALGPGPERGRARFGWAAGAAVFGCVAVLAAGVALVSDVHLRASRSAVSQGFVTGAAEEARQAQAVQPWAATPYLQLALVEEEQDLEAAMRAVDEALERAPEDWRVWLVATRLRTKAGDVPGALVALRRTTALSPRPRTLGLGEEPASKR